MTQRELTLKTLRHEPINKIVWQPRIYYWYYGNRLQNKLPSGYSDDSMLKEFFHLIDAYENKSLPPWVHDKSMLEIYDILNASPRYPQEVLGVLLYQLKMDEKKIKRTVKTDGATRIITLKTAVGTLQEVTRIGYHVEYPIKTVADLEIIKYILENTEFVFDHEAFRIADEAFGDRGVITTFYPRAPYQRLIVEYMGAENTLYAMMDYPQQMNDFMDFISDWDDDMYDVLLKSPVQILDFGDNIDAFIDSPKIYKEYLMPYYQKRVDQIHQAGKLCTIHMDGALKPLLPLIDEVDFDGIEAVTPLPQGDVTLEEIKEALGNKILLDGIPAIFFLPDHPLEDLIQFTEKILTMFAPNLILGVSDELPPTGDIERLKIVSEIVKNFKIPV